MGWINAGWWPQARRGEPQIAWLHERQFALTGGITPEKMPQGTLMTLLCFPHSPADDFSPAWWWCDGVCIVNKPAPRPLPGATVSIGCSRTLSSQKMVASLCFFYHPHRKSKFMLEEKQNPSFHSGVASHWRFPAVSRTKDSNEPDCDCLVVNNNNKKRGFWSQRKTRLFMSL